MGEGHGTYLDHSCNSLQVWKCARRIPKPPWAVEGREESEPLIEMIPAICILFFEEKIVNRVHKLQYKFNKIINEKIFKTFGLKDSKIKMFSMKLFLKMNNCRTQKAV